MARPRVLVLLAAYNGSPWIRAQLDSVFAQAGVDITLVASDDASSDDTYEQIVALARDGDEVTRSTLPHGTSAAQNFLGLIRRTPLGDHDFVALADQDDLWEREKLVRGCEAMRGAGAAGYSCAVTAFWGDGRKSILKQNGSLTRADFLFEGAGQGCTFLLSGSFYSQLQEFFRSNLDDTNEIHYHDWSIYALSRCWNLSWIFDQMPLVLYRQHGKNDTGARVSLAGVRKRFNLVRQGWYKRQLSSILRLCLIAAPSDPYILKWHRIFTMQSGLARSLRIGAFCILGSRRRLSDRLVLFVAAVLGWI